ncbi:MAG: hypothetical protein ACSHX7_06050 [Luteolibacter sp.]
MSERVPCPFLPTSDVGVVKRHGVERGAEFYMNSLGFAQGYWLEGKPAQAILQLNKAFSADLSSGDEILEVWPWPYEALGWICETAADGSCGFLGNPVRHFQHLATRMSGERAEIRSWRAWACFWLAKRILEGRGDFSLDGRQIAREGIFFPREERVLVEADFSRSVP